MANPRFPQLIYIGLSKIKKGYTLEASVLLLLLLLHIVGP